MCAQDRSFRAITQANLLQIKLALEALLRSTAAFEQEDMNFSNHFELK
jgi:hypothetical protein